MQGVETLMGVQLPDDIGEWVCDGVILCEVINKLHPGLITKNISRPTPGAVSLHNIVGCSCIILLWCDNVFVANLTTEADCECVCFH